MTILIPAYKPDNRLIELIKRLKGACDFDIVIVNDGSGQGYKNIFNTSQELGCYVLQHGKNKGKGEALKSGFQYLKDIEDEGVVCADCDGQHLIEDIIKVANSIKENINCIILGTRRFVGDVPLRSRIGNTISRKMFSLVSGVHIFDTQTGLRGFSAGMLEWLCEINGKRYEYEMNVLLEGSSLGYGFQQVEIETVYLEENKSSHFNPIKDSILIYWPLIKFSFSSIFSGVLDFLLLGVIQALTNNLFISVVGARVISAAFNYSINRFYVFSNNRRGTVKESLLKYILLASFILIINYGIIYLYDYIIGIPLFWAKLLTEITIFTFSYFIQKKYIF